MKKDIYVRNMEKRDLPAIVSMEERQTGVARPEDWEKRIEISEAIRPHWASLVAELDNRVVGFVLRRAGELPDEFLSNSLANRLKTTGSKPSSRWLATVRPKCSSFLAGWVSFTARCCITKKNFPVDQRSWTF